jgi:hypothetical protein
MALLKSSDFQCGTVIGCHLSNKSVCQISALLVLSWSTVSVIVKWKCLGATTAQPQSGRPHKLKIIWPRLQHSLLSSKLSLEATSAQELFIGSFMKWDSMAEPPHTSLRSPCAMPSIAWSDVKLSSIGLFSGGNTFSRVMNHTSPSGSTTDEYGFGGFQENATCPNATCLKMSQGRSADLGSFPSRI